MGTFQINYNSAAATALNALNDTSEKLNTLQRQLSTGLRINDASDDPAGLIKSETFRTQILGVNQAKSNVQEAINYIRTADAQMSEITQLLQSAKGFALQAQQSATIDDDQRAALNSQLKKAISAIDTTAKGATYGNKKILDGTAGIAAVSIDNKTDAIAFTSSFNQLPATTSTVKGTKTVVDTPATVATLTGSATYVSGSSTVGSSGTVSVTGPTGTRSITYTSGVTDATTLASLIEAQFANTGVHAAYSSTHIALTTATTGLTSTITIIDANGVVGTTLTAAGQDAITHQQDTVGEINVSLTTKAAAAIMTGAAHAGVYTALTSVIGANSNLTINGYAFTAFTNTNTVQEVRDAINNAKLGVTASFNSAGTQLVLTSDNLGSNQKINLVDTGGIIIAAGTSSVAGVDAKASITLGTTTVIFDKGTGTLLRDIDGNEINLTTTGNNMALSTPIQIGQLTLGNSSFCIDPNNAQPLNISLQDCSAKNLGLRAVAGKSLADVDLTISANTADAIKIIDQSIKDIINRRATVGSIQKNTLESALRSLRVSQENLQASESNIRNLDFANAISESVRLQILSGSGLAQLAQANQSPQQVLNLLKG